MSKMQLFRWSDGWCDARIDPNSETIGRHSRGMECFVPVLGERENRGISRCDQLCWGSNLRSDPSFGQVWQAERSRSVERWECCAFEHLIQELTQSGLVEELSLMTHWIWEHRQLQGGEALENSTPIGWSASFKITSSGFDHLGGGDCTMPRKQKSKDSLNWTNLKESEVSHVSPARNSSTSELHVQPKSIKELIWFNCFFQAVLTKEAILEIYTMLRLTGCWWERPSRPQGHRWEGCYFSWGGAEGRPQGYLHKDLGWHGRDICIWCIFTVYIYIHSNINIHVCLSFIAGIFVMALVAPETGIGYGCGAWREIHHQQGSWFHKSSLACRDCTEREAIKLTFGIPSCSHLRPLSDLPRNLLLQSAQTRQIWEILIIWKLSDAET